MSGEARAQIPQGQVASWTFRGGRCSSSIAPAINPSVKPRAFRYERRLTADEKISAADYRSRRGELCCRLERLPERQEWLMPVAQRRR
jgi:hypothetical protein